MPRNERQPRGGCRAVCRWLLACAITNSPSINHEKSIHAEAHPLFTETHAMRVCLLTDRAHTSSIANDSLQVRTLLENGMGEDGGHGGGEGCHSHAVPIRNGGTSRRIGRSNLEANALLDEAQVISPRRKRSDSLKAARLIDEGDLHVRGGDPARGVSLLEEALRICRRLYGDADHPDMARCLNRLGRAYLDHGDYAKAEKASYDALLICRELYGTIDRSEHAAAYIAVARARRELGSYTNVGLYFAQALDMRRRLHPNGSDPALAESLAEMGNYYIDRGDYARGEPMLLESYEMYLHLFPDADDPGYARCMSYLAAYYRERGDLDKGEGVLRRSHEMRGRLYRGRDHLHLAEDLIAIGAFREGRGDSVGAQSALAEALGMLRRIYGRGNHFVLAEALGTIGRLYADHGNYGEARQHLENGARMYRSLCGEGDHPGLAGSLCDLALLHCHRRRIGPADSLFELATAMYRRLYVRRDQLDLAISMERIARYAETFGLKERASSAYQVLLGMLPRLTRTSSLFEGEAQQIMFQRRLSQISHSLLRFYLRKEDAGAIYDAALWSKGRVLAAVEWRNRVLMELGKEDGAIIAMWGQLGTTRQLISDTRAHPDSSSFDTWSAEREKMLARVEKIEGALARSSVRLMRSHQRISWRSIKRELGPREAAVEFVAVPDVDSELGKGSVHLYALVLRRSFREPALVHLGDERAIARIMRHPVEEEAKESGSYIHDARRRVELYQHVWAPFDSLLNGVRTVYLTPDGLLNRIAFGPLTSDTGEMLLKRYDLRYLFTSRDLKPPPSIATTRQPLPRRAAVFGGVRYDADSATLSRAIEMRGTEEHSSAWTPDGDRSGEDRFRSDFRRETVVGRALAPLHGTRREAEGVSDLLTYHGYSVTPYLDADATEEAFLRLSSPTVLHIATHGYFFSDLRLPREELNRMLREGGIRMIEYGENPLLRSGLLLAGADRVWTLQRPFEGIGDGIVTAYDVAHMDLSRTELVVLSACETGRGDIDGSEGVFGLKRAFRAAGARSVMMSLWKVPDAQTRELMELFYTNWLKKNMQKHDALSEAQRELLGKDDDPYNWAGFVLVGE